MFPQVVARLNVELDPTLTADGAGDRRFVESAALVVQVRAGPIADTLQFH